MGEQFRAGQWVAIIRTDTGKLVATATVDKVTDRDVRTETPYEQRQSYHERDKVEFERRIAIVEEALRRERESYERLLAMVEKGARLIAEAGEDAE